MKTADLIPFILIELNESDKYGFELTKNIETKSNGKILIKQPTLYTLLKKLEKSKFITSYWQDSDLGGKRHYYKITDNGKMQLTTLPSYDILMQNLITNEDTENENLSNNIASTQVNNTEENEKNIKHTHTTPLEAVLPTDEVFKDESIDTKTSAEINQENAEMLKAEDNKKEESFATNIVVAKFVEIKPSTPPVVKEDDSKSFNNIVNLDFKITSQENDIKYVDYVNLKKSSEYKKSKLFSKLTIFRAMSVSLFIIAMLVSFALLSSKFETTTLYYITLIFGLIIAIFYPITTLLKIDSIKRKFKQKNYKFSLKHSLISKLSILCFVVLIVLVINIHLGNNTFIKMLNIKNFANFYVPTLFATSMFIDSLIGHIISFKLKK